MNKSGRPRNFDEHATMTRIMNLFQKNGFENTTFEQIVAESGLSRSSLYNTFGGKKDLIERAMQMYIETESDQLARQLSDEESGVNLLQSIIGNYSRSASRGCKDCLVRKALLQNANSTDPPVHVSSIKKSLNQIWRAITLAVGRARRKRKAKKKTNAALNDEERAAIILGLIHGTAVIARSGKQSELLNKIQSGAEKLLG